MSESSRRFADRPDATTSRGRASRARIEHATARSRVLALGAALVLAGCTSPPTSVLVIVDTDAPARVLSMRATVATGSGSSANPTVHDWSRTGSPSDLRFPASFGIVPGNAPNDARVLLEVEVTFGPASAGDPVVTARRIARFNFAPHVPSLVRLFVPASCVADVQPPQHCTSTSLPCTVSEYCAEQTPEQTCGENGQCVPLDVPVMPLPPDGSVPPSDAAADVTGDVQRDGANDVRAVDVSEACTPSCGTAMCGSDGCGGSCGTCPAGQMCSAGRCVCAPNCAGRSCGSDGCGGSCGTCASGVCNASGQCVPSCTPNCSGRVCGSDGCSGMCGSCGTGQMCNASGQCVCAPNCAGRACGPNGCGGSCGTCGSGQACDGSGHCFACSMGAVCSVGNECTSGTTDCTSGSAVCTNIVNRPVGTSCTGGVCNGSGTCVPCMQGASCTPANSCISSAAIDCSTGSPVCQPTGYVASGTLCAGAYVGTECDGSGHCQCPPPRSGQCFRCGSCSYSCTLNCG